jgi:hypothetical protein
MKELKIYSLDISGYVVSEDDIKRFFKNFGLKICANYKTCHIYKSCGNKKPFMSLDTSTYCASRGGKIKLILITNFQFQIWRSYEKTSHNKKNN